MLTDEQVQKYKFRLIQSRMRVLCSNGFLGVLLMHMLFSVDENIETAATDGKRIYFGAQFLDELSDKELDFVMMHEIMHVVLRHLQRTGKRNRHLFNVASDIVINSNVANFAGGDLRAITIEKYGVSMHLAPDGKEGHLYSAEEVYEMLLDKTQGGSSSSSGEDEQSDESGGQSAVNPSSWHKSGGGCSDELWDDHTRWDRVCEQPEDLQEGDLWRKRIQDAAEAAKARGRGIVPACVERAIDELKDPQTDWRTLLSAFIQEDVCDYSLTPPDRRYDGGDFYLPDFNEKDESVKNVLFMIDTSGSMTKKMVTQAYSEIKGAIDQFNGKLQGWLGFFDAAVVEPTPFVGEDEFQVIRPKGGGGTDFAIIFKYVQTHMQENPPASIVVLTDGYAPFPDEKETQGIPVCWLINNKDVNPPWGTVARIK